MIHVIHVKVVTIVHSRGTERDPLPSHSSPLARSGPGILPLSLAGAPPPRALGRGVSLSETAGISEEACLGGLRGQGRSEPAGVRHPHR